MELTKIIIGIILVSVVSLTMMIAITDGVTTYQPSSVPTNYNDTFVRMYKNLNTTLTAVEQTESKASEITGNSNVVSDFLGFYFGNAYKAIKLFIDSMKLTKDIAADGIENTMGASPLSNVWIMAIGGIVIVVLIGILLHFVIKSERL